MKLALLSGQNCLIWRLQYATTQVFLHRFTQDSAVLAIKNTDLASLQGQQNGEVEEFFGRFSDWHETFTLAKAVRMNASFSYVSPADSLPTEPVRRVMDAGYFDNDSVYSASAWLRQEEVASLIDNNTSGVIVLQIRTSRSREYSERWYECALDWVSSPLETFIAATESTNVFHNNEALRRLQLVLPRVPVDTVAFANVAESATVEKSWYITAEEVTETHDQLYSTSNREALWTNQSRGAFSQRHEKNKSRIDV